jgi:uncharacterized protein with FMN-binding domain
VKRIVLATVATVVGLIMLLSFKTRPLPATVATPPPAVGDPPSSTTSSTSTTSTTSSGRSGSGRASTTTTTAPAGAGSPSSTTAATGTSTYTGDPAQTRYGPVEVEITVTNGQLATAQAVEYPTESPRDRQINAWAIPELNQEAVAAKNAKIDMLSGATYTSDGYATSLQSALDKAGLS